MGVEFNPIIVPVPIALLADAIRVPLSSGVVLQSVDILRAEGYLAALTSGPFTVEIREIRDGSLIGTLTWNAAGFATTGPLNRVLDTLTSGISIAPIGLGVGAQSCTVVLWCVMVF